MISLGIGDILKVEKDGISYRVIAIVSGQYIYLCELNINKLIISVVSYAGVIEKISKKEFVLLPKENIIVDYSEIPKAHLEKLEIRKKIIEDVQKLYGPTFIELCGNKTKPELKHIYIKYGICKSNFWKIVRRYLQSGLDINSLIDKRNFRKQEGEIVYKNRTGRKCTDSRFTSNIVVAGAVVEQFDDAINYLKSGKNITYKKAYDYLILKYYMREVMGRFVELGDSEKPTYRQFHYYVKKRVSQKELDKIRTSSMEQRNNRRFLSSDSLKDVSGPMDLCEMDACEVDVSVVYGPDAERNGIYKCVGRPVLYAMIDVYSRVVVAVGVSFDNNSNMGFTNCLLNLAEDKVKYAAEHGVKIDSERLWPSRCLPNRLRVDRGAEFRGIQVERICNELGINRELVSAGTGSLKGVVEQFFHQFHTAIRAHIEKHGEITKRHDSNHHEESTMTIDDFTTLLINHVLFHNQRALDGYPYTADMIKNEVKAIPILLWEYGISRYFNPKPVVSTNQFLYTLCMPVNASVSNNKGICYKGLYYLPHGDEDFYDHCFALGRKREKIEIRIDERSVDNIYYKKGDKLVRASLNLAVKSNEGFSGMTWTEYNLYFKKKSRLKKEGQNHNVELDALSFAVNHEIVKDAAKRKLVSGVVASDTKEMREAREIAKHDKQYEQRISKRLDYDDKVLPLAENSNSGNILGRNPVYEEITEDSDKVSVPSDAESDKNKPIKVDSLKDLLKLI